MVVRQDWPTACVQGVALAAYFKRKPIANNNRGQRGRKKESRQWLRRPGWANNGPSARPPQESSIDSEVQAVARPNSNNINNEMIAITPAGRRKNSPPLTREETPAISGIGVDNVAIPVRACFKSRTLMGSALRIPHDPLIHVVEAPRLDPLRPDWLIPVRLDLAGSDLDQWLPFPKWRRSVSKPVTTSRTCC